jgi:transposase
MECADLDRRQLPSHFDPWQGVYSQYQRWRKAGFWTRIVAILDQPETLPAAA